MSKKIAFMCWDQYTGEIIRTKPLGGIATSVIMLAEAFTRKGYVVEVCNGVKKQTEYEGVIYRPLADVKNVEVDLAISNNTAGHLLKVKRGVPVVWQHNRTSLGRAWKRGELWALLSIRPDFGCHCTRRPCSMPGAKVMMSERPTGSRFF